MGKNANFVSHKKSKLKENGGPKLPLASDIVEGEIAINFGKDVETLSIKNESGDVVTFSSDNYYTEKKLGSGFTGENSGVTVTEAIQSLDLGNEVEVNSGDTPTGQTIELWVDESIEPVTVEVYTKAETNALLNNKSDKTSTVSNVSYDSESGKLQETINGTTTDVCDVISKGFTVEYSNGVLNLITIGGATAVNDEGTLKLTF